MFGFFKRRSNKPWGPSFDLPDLSSPQAIVLSYTRDYKIWNDYCYQEHDRNRDASGADRRRMTDRFTELHRGFLIPYLAPDVRLHNISYGSQSLYDPHYITFDKLRSHKGIKRQFFTMARPDHRSDFCADISEKEPGVWQLHQVYFIDTMSGKRRKFWPGL